MEGNQICILAAQIHGSVHNKSNILTLSTRTLDTILSSFELLEEQSTTFHVKQPQNFKAELLRDLQYLSNYIQETKTLKLYIDSYDDTPEINITKFRKLISLELSKVDVNTVIGLQLLRSQLQKLICQKTQNSLSDILINCGGDKSRASCWNELKEASFISNNIAELDLSLECAPWLHTLDLSHNEITNFEALSCLVNLKYLNLAYNKLEGVSALRGQICNRLQNLILKNNFIEDITGLRTLTNLWVLDLSNNCLVDHKSLIAISHLAALQWLNLQSNPLSFHPNHRNRTASYLHMNTATTHFVLNNVVLSKTEKKLVGSYYPLQMRSNNSFSTDSLSLTTEKARRVRHVVIEEENSVRENSIPSLPPTPKQYLETKKQIENLHEKFGESWLNSQSGLLDVLGLESFSLPLSTSPYEADFTIYSGDFSQEPVKVTKEVVVESIDHINEEYEKKIEVLPDEPDIEGEESIYLATVKSETDPIFIVIGQTHLSERECSTGNEREKWHLDSITKCEILDEELTTVRVDFETMRKSRKQRIYVFEDEIEAFVACIKNKINSRSPKKKDDVKYQCMKCSTVFAKIKNESILGESAVKCPSCDSTLVVEEV